jgi:hypothetical protein
MSPSSRGLALCLALGAPQPPCFADVLRDIAGAAGSEAVRGHLPVLPHRDVAASDPRHGTATLRDAGAVTRQRADGGAISRRRGIHAKDKIGGSLTSLWSGNSFVPDRHRPTWRGAVRADDGPADVLLHYLEQCASRTGIGLAPAWAEGLLDAHERRLLSGCLLAHVNLDGRQVRIRLHVGPGAEREAPSLPGLRLEGAFFGDVFAQPPRLYACAGDEGETREAWLASHARRCTVARAAPARDTLCGFRRVGLCRAEAFRRPEGDYGATASFVYLPSAPGAFGDPRAIGAASRQAPAVQSGGPARPASPSDDR